MVNLRSHILYLSYFLAVFAAPIGAQESADDIEEYAEEQVEIDPWYGHYGIRLYGGIYNFKTVYSDASTAREYSLPLGWTMAGGEISLRMGKDKSGFLDRNFMYYRSNDDLFFDLEIGFKAFIPIDDSLPSSYDVKVTDKATGNVTSEDTIELLGDSVINSAVGIVSGASVPGSTNPDQIEISDRILFGGVAANVMLFYVNQYYAFTALNWIMNLGGLVHWSDSSLGLSYRFSLYDDYSDPYKAAHFSDDNIHGGLFIGVRQFIQLTDWLRLGGRYFFPIGHHAANLFYSEDETNYNEQIIEGWVDLMIIQNFLLTIGYEYHSLSPNLLSSKSNNYSGNYFSNRQNMKMASRTSGEVYFSIGFELPANDEDF